MENKHLFCIHVHLCNHKIIINGGLVLTRRWALTRKITVITSKWMLDKYDWTKDARSLWKYRIAGNFRGVKYSRFSRIKPDPRKFYPRILEIWVGKRGLGTRLRRDRVYTRHRTDPPRPRRKNSEQTDDILRGTWPTVTPALAIATA